MKTLKLFIMAFSFFGLLGCNSKKENSKQNSTLIAKQITISELGHELKLLAENKTEFNFFGITSNGIDCIYFVKNHNNFDIEFEAITSEQIPYLEKLNIFGKEEQYNVLHSSYGNKPHYPSDKSAPVIRLETNSDINNTIKIATKIQSDIFNNNNETKYEVVP